MKLPLFLKKYFWDVDFTGLDLSQDFTYITVRLLEYGDSQAIRWLLKNVDAAKIKEAILKSRELSAKSVNFWSLFFNFNKTKARCLRKSYQKIQSSHWPY